VKKVAIIGASGYTGIELMRLAALHPLVELVAVSSEQFAGKTVAEIFPFLGGRLDLAFQALSQHTDLQKADCVFIALPHQKAMDVVPGLLKKGVRVVDLSADFRFRTAAVYEQWYKPHTAPDLLADAVYGLSEVYRETIRNAALVANPGCYPTATLLPLIPLLKSGLVNADGIVVDAKSGVSGAGRGAVLTSLFAEVNEGVKAYKVGRHQHAPEIEQELSFAAQKQVVITFTPHLIPMNRGILGTLYATLKGKATLDDVLQCYRTFYAGSGFVRICPPGIVPSTHQVRGSNYCDIGCIVDVRTDRMIIVSALDNLLKGGAGQAVQNMNIMAGFEEGAGINQLPLFP
jgi:N-acetyl-gamma-glutamyl-phosphate reductase